MSEPSATHQTPEEHPYLMERMLFFSDAVFAIVLTLLALDLRLGPNARDENLLSAVYAIRGSVIAFVTSFALVGVFWMAHAVTLRAVARFDWVVAAVNLVQLFAVTLTPFASAVVGRFGNMGQAWRFYCVVILAISLSQCALIAVSHRDEPRLVHAAHHGRMWRRLMRAATPGAAFLVGLALSFAGQPLLASDCWVLVPVFLIALRFVSPERRPAPAAAADSGEPQD
jgi:uncharacterized membrane protein